MDVNNNTNNIVLYYTIYVLLPSTLMSSQNKSVFYEKCLNA